MYIWGCHNELGKIGYYYVQDWVTSNPDYYLPIEGFVIDKEYKTHDTFMNLPVLDFADLKSNTQVFFPIGYKNCNRLREQKFNECLERGIVPLSIISDKTVVANSAKLGIGNWIQELVNIQHCVEIGNNNIFWGQGVHIGHSSVIGSHNFISTNSTISGNCKIGNNCFFGVNTCIKDNIEIPDGTIVGMGSIITKSPVKPYQVFLAGVNNLYHKSALEI